MVRRLDSSSNLNKRVGKASFYQAGAISGMFGSVDADLAGIITHEFFHRAGLGEGDIRALHSDIQKNCGTPGLNIGK